MNRERKIRVWDKDKKQREILDHLESRYGGQWLWVDDCEDDEFLLFSDGLVYDGFMGNPNQFDRYSNAIKQIR